MAGATRSAPIATVVNTHANGDHCYGNQLVAGAEIVASSAAAHEMTEVPPAMLAALNHAPGEIGELFRGFFGDFDFDGIELTLPTRTFDGRLELEVGGRVVELIEVGPAHTAGDSLAHVPDAKTIYTGDILFIGGTPIVWAGPLSNWIAACDLILGMDVETVVPGHGPLTDKSGVAAVRDYLAYIEDGGDAAPCRRHGRLGGGTRHRAERVRRVGRVGPDLGQRRDRLPHHRSCPPESGCRRAVPEDGAARTRAVTCGRRCRTRAVTSGRTVSPARARPGACPCAPARRRRR